MCVAEGRRESSVRGRTWRLRLQAQRRQRRGRLRLLLLRRCLLAAIAFARRCTLRSVSPQCFAVASADVRPIDATSAVRCDWCDRPKACARRRRTRPVAANLTQQQQASERCARQRTDRIGSTSARIAPPAVAPFAALRLPPLLSARSGWNRASGRPRGRERWKGNTIRVETKEREERKGETQRRTRLEWTKEQRDGGWLHERACSEAAVNEKIRICMKYVSSHDLISAADTTCFDDAQGRNSDDGLRARRFCSKHQPSRIRRLTESYKMRHDGIRLRSKL